MAWFNSDGLLVKLGTEEATPGVGGEHSVPGAARVYEFILDLTKLTTSDTIVDDNAWFPKNAFIEEVEVETIVGAVSGGVSTLDIGLIKTDRTTADSATGLVAALAKASIDTAGKRVNLTVGSTSVGAKVGAVLAQTDLVTAKANVAVFTAGVIRVRVKVTF